MQETKIQSFVFRLTEVCYGGLAVALIDMRFLSPKHQVACGWFDQLEKCRVSNMIIVINIISFISRFRIIGQFVVHEC